MKLHWSPRSPFVRKVMVTAHELGLADRIETVRTVVGMTQPNPALMRENPLNKLPTLLLPDGRILYDSHVICEFLQATAGGDALLPARGDARWEVLRRHALANGLLDLLILWRNEREKPHPHDRLLDACALKTDAALAAMQAELPVAGRCDLGSITAAIASDYLDFRFAHLGWRDRFPALDAWQRGFAERPSMRATQVVDG
jgi:glutathione S-transferase